MHRFVAPITCLALALALATGAAGAATPGRATTTVAGFQKDLVSVLALRAEPGPLLGAALLARTLNDPPRTLTFHALIARAAAASGAGPAIAWAGLADCQPEAMDCPNAQALATLERQAPDNAAVWLMVLGQASNNDDDDAARSAFARAAATSVYDDYRGDILQALVEAVGALPPPADLYTGTQAPATSAAGVRALIVFGLGNLQPTPGFQGAAAICAKAGAGTPTRVQCLRLAKVLVWAGAPLARSLGLHLEQTLAPDAATREQARDAWRDLAWQIHNFGRITLAARHDPQRAASLLQLARKGGTQMSLILAALRDAGIPVAAPAGWQPRGSTSTPASGSSPH